MFSNSRVLSLSFSRRHACSGLTLTRAAAPRAVIVCVWRAATCKYGLWGVAGSTQRRRALPPPVLFTTQYTVCLPPRADATRIQSPGVNPSPPPINTGRWQHAPPSRIIASPFVNLPYTGEVQHAPHIAFHILNPYPPTRQVAPHSHTRRKLTTLAALSPSPSRSLSPVALALCEPWLPGINSPRYTYTTATQARATYGGGLCGMPACGQAVRCGAGALAWHRGPVCACTRVCWCHRIYTYIHTYTTATQARGTYCGLCGVLS